MEEKEVKKTTRKKATTKKVEEKKVEEKKDEKIEITLDGLQKMIAQMAAMAMANNTLKEENVSEKKLTKKKDRRPK